MRDSSDVRAQSESLGFLLIFSVVILTIGLVTVTGFTGLDNVRDFQRTSNAEQAFIVLANNVDDVVRAGAPDRTTEIRIADASLALETAETSVTIADGNGTTNATVETHPIVYQSGSGTTIAYRSGALVREDEGSAVLFRDPGFVLTEERVILPVVNTSPVGGARVGGTTAVSVRTQSGGTRVVAAGQSVDNVTLAVSSPRADVWVRYFERFEGGGPVTDVQRSGNTVEATIDTDRVYVTITRVDVRLQ